MAILNTVAALDAVVGPRPATAHLKSIPMVDPHCRAFLSACTFAVLGVVDSEGRQKSQAIGGEPGVIRAASTTQVTIPEDIARGVGEGAAALVCLVPGYRETLRINGFMHDSVMQVQEAFLHCAKCIIRSELWFPTGSMAEDGRDVNATPTLSASAAHRTVTENLDHVDVREFLTRARFATVTSVDAHGNADVSPKGDPAGFIRPIGPSTLTLPDRPGNKRTDTFRNLLQCPEVSLLAFVPGDNRVVEAHGVATVRDDEQLREPFAVRGKLPKVVLLIEDVTAVIRHEPALTQARLWFPDRQHLADTLPRPSRIWTDHVKLNEDPGLVARLARTALQERLMRASLDQDYSRNLY